MSRSAAFTVCLLAVAFALFMVSWGAKAEIEELRQEIELIKAQPEPQPQRPFSRVA